MAGRKKPKYIVGIDLGTTNSAVAYANISSAKRYGSRSVKVLHIPQLVAAAQVGPAEMLPSSLYLPPEHEQRTGLRLPWSGDDDPEYVVGVFAQAQGAKVPGRLVTSAKSWLSYGGVDRIAAILPWGAGEGVSKVSPVMASARFLEHIVQAWNAAFPKAPLADQDVVLTVPASFDDVARTLTVQAAADVGLRDNLVLLEEPQAAFYDYFRTHSTTLSDDPREILTLVVDVGGGTTDFTLIQVSWNTEGERPVPEVRRIAIGDHILLGGDNMDLALAHMAEHRISGQRGALDASRMGALVQSCRQAKEVLLGHPDEAPERFTVAIPGRGSKLVGGVQSCELTRAEVEEAILDGFVPRSSVDEQPKRGGRSALSAWGLPYASDPAITRHIAAFLARHGTADGPAVPDAVLLNGGVFKGDGIRGQVLDTLASWRPEGAAELEVLDAASFDLAVARGAATFGLVRHGVGHRIGGGAARSYFVGVHRSRKDTVRQGVCLLPHHVEPGEPVLMRDRVFQLVLGRPVRFSLFATTVDRGDELGALVGLDADGFVELPPIQTVLETEEDVRELPVTLRAELSEVGILEVWAQSVDRDTRYRLEFSLRDPEPSGDDAANESNKEPEPALTTATRDRLEEVFRRTYGKPRKDVDPREIKWIRRSLETELEAPRDEWAGPVCRAVWDLLKVGIRRRRRSERHESTFFHLTGFCLRPGFGDPFDDWRVAEILKLYETGVHFLKDAEVWNAWWIMWRRIAGGLDETIQTQLLDWLEPWLRPGPDMRNRKRPKMMGPEEATRLVGALERIPVSRKIAWGDWCLEQVSGQQASGIPAWSLGRLGARQPFYGSSHQVVPPQTAKEWVDALLALPWTSQNNAGLAAATIARCTGDRVRDLEPGLRETVAQRLEAVPAMAAMAPSVREVVELTQQDERRVFGDSLPEGLKLVQS